MDFIKNIVARFDWSITFFTVMEIILVISIYPFMQYANPVFFMENGIVENFQLLILFFAMIICLTSKQNKQLFLFCAFIVVFLMIRETNLGRSYFCAKYLTPTDVCKWQNLKYGYMADWVRIFYALVIAVYAIYVKIWKIIWLYVKKAPIYVWEFILMIIGIIGGTLAEKPSFDSEIAEECFETLFYICLCYTLWRYTRHQIQK